MSAMDARKTRRTWPLISVAVHGLVRWLRECRHDWCVTGTNGFGAASEEQCLKCGGYRHRIHDHRIIGREEWKTGKMSTTPETDQVVHDAMGTQMNTKEWQAAFRALLIHAGEMERQRTAAGREAMEYAAQRCRYYLKHQDYPSRWEDKSEYQQGVQIACDNLAAIMLEEAGKYPPNAIGMAAGATVPPLKSD